MPKIENWSRLENEPGGPAWQHDEKRITVQVMPPSSIRGKGYDVVKRQGGAMTTIQGGIETKEMAMDKARAYMRANTNPGSHGSPSQRRSRANRGR